MMHHRRVGLLCLAICLAFSNRRFASAATPEQVDEAIKKAIAYIYSQQSGGNWELVSPRANEVAPSVEGLQWGGLSSLATCALLYAKESPQDPRLKEALTWLKNSEIVGIYALGFRCQVWQMAQNYEGAKELARKDRDFLLQAVYKRGDFTKGMFPYAFYKGKPQG